MINLIDATYSIDNSQAINFSTNFNNELIQGINWWNSENFHYYLKNLHKNPWNLFETLCTSFENKKFIIELKNFQLSKFLMYSEEVVECFFSQLKNKDNIYLKIYDSLNFKDNIEKILKLAIKYNLNVIGGIFLRPDLENYPDCHLELINLFKVYNITYISLIEPLGILKEGDLSKIKQILDASLKTENINLSINQTKFNQAHIVNEAIKAGISEIEFDRFNRNFGRPNLETILESLRYLKIDVSPDEFPLSLLQNTESIQDDSLKGSELANIFQKLFYFKDVPVGLIESLYKLIQLTNVKFDINNIIREIKTVQKDLGNPPLIDPFRTIIISQAIFRLQNSKKGIKTLDTSKYLSGYWGYPTDPFLSEFNDYFEKIQQLKSKTNIFNSIDFSIPAMKHLIQNNLEFTSEDNGKLLFLIAPQETESFFSEYPNKIKFLDFSKRINIASLIKAIMENKQVSKDKIVSQKEFVEKEDIDNFKWRMVSKLFQLGRF